MENLHQKPGEEGKFRNRSPRRETLQRRAPWWSQRRGPRRWRQHTSWGAKESIRWMFFLGGKCHHVFPMIWFFELWIEIIQYHPEKIKTSTKLWKQTVIQLIIMELFEFKDSLLHGGFSINGCSIICSNSNSCIRLEIPWKIITKMENSHIRCFPPLVCITQPESSGWICPYFHLPKFPWSQGERTILPIPFPQFFEARDFCVKHAILHQDHWEIAAMKCVHFFSCTWIFSDSWFWSFHIAISESSEHHLQCTTDTGEFEMQLLLTKSVST